MYFWKLNFTLRNSVFTLFMLSLHMTWLGFFFFCFVYFWLFKVFFPVLVFSSLPLMLYVWLLNYFLKAYHVVCWASWISILTYFINFKFSNLCLKIIFILYLSSPLWGFQLFICFDHILYVLGILFYFFTFLFAILLSI